MKTSMQGTPRKLAEIEKEKKRQKNESGSVKKIRKALDREHEEQVRAMQAQIKSMMQGWMDQR